LTGDQKGMVFVIDDDKALRDGLQLLLESLDLDVACFASTGEFAAFARPDVPSCLVLDVRMPAQNGLDFQQQLLREGIDIPIIFISGHGDIPISVRAMKAGAIEFLSKPFREQELLDAIDLGLRRDRDRRQEAARDVALYAAYAALSAGEKDVLVRVVRGLLNRRIADELGVSEITVKVRRGQIMRKMGAASLADLVEMGITLGLR
jgi:FixJ family two-component response regulator